MLRVVMVRCIFGFNTKLDDLEWSVKILFNFGFLFSLSIFSAKKIQGLLLKKRLITRYAAQSCRGTIIG